MSKPVVLIAEELSPATMQALGPDFEIRHVDGADRSALIPALSAGVDAVLIRSATQMDAEAIAAAKGLKVNSDEIFIKGITSLPNEGVITTKEIDKLLAEIAASYTGSHYDYSKLAANIAISSYHKETNKAEQQIRYKNIQPCSCGWVYFIRGLFLK